MLKKVGEAWNLWVKRRRAKGVVRWEKREEGAAKKGKDEKMYNTEERKGKRYRKGGDERMDLSGK